MASILRKCRNSFISIVYGRIVKPILFSRDPEDVHDIFLSFGKFLGSNAVTRAFTGAAFGYRNRVLRQEIFGTYYKNPVGLAAGFDKDALLVNILPYVGFGFEEIGSVTGIPCAGNDKPRLWRLKRSRALQVYYGLKNEGSEKISLRLRKSRKRIPLWVSIAKANSEETVDTKAGIADYKMAYDNMKDSADAIVINISCPNAFGGQPFTSREKLEKLLNALEISESRKPVMIKLSPDLSEEELDAIIDVALKAGVKGFICTNLSKQPERIKHNLLDPVVGKGGISGMPIRELSNDMISRVYGRVRGKAIIIGTGGIFSAEDAYEKIRAGASLVQLITGMVYRGPSAISSINMGIADLLRRDGYNNISEAVGSGLHTNSK